MLAVKDLKVLVEQKEILKGVSLTIPKGEIHVLMGPNGSGKSTLGHVLMGAENYRVQGGQIALDAEDITPLATAQRANKGLFLAFQSPVVIPGLKISEYLRNLYCLRKNTQVGVAEFRKILKEKTDLLKMDRSSLQRYLNDGFSGGEMKRLEILQMLLLEPKVAILDEIDSGVDVDGQKIIADCILHAVKEFGTSFLIVTHYERMIQFLQPSQVHIILDGKISRSGDLSLVSALQREGYYWVRKSPEEV